MIDANHNAKSTYAASADLGGDAHGEHVTKGVTNGCQMAPGRDRGGKSASGKRIRDREGEKARRQARMVPVGSCGESAEQIRRNLGIFRREMECHVLQARGVITPVEQLAINAAVRCEMAAELAQQWLRNHEATLKPAERLQHALAIVNATAGRDKAVERLKLPGGGDTKAEISRLYESMAAEATEKSAAASEASKTSPDTIDGKAANNASGEVTA